MYNSGHVDRYYGMVDEVRITIGALSPEEFLFAGGGGCPNPGSSGNNCSADLDGDCVIGLGDLGSLLPNYNMTGTGLAGDFDGDNDVDLSDLGTLLAQYGDDCN